LAHLSADLEITAEAGYLPQSVEKIIQIAVANGAHVTVEAGKYLPQSLEKFAQLGRNDVTIRI
jgi:hypothetical protein